jgi:hypothetical protein
VPPRCHARPVASRPVRLAVVVAAVSILAAACAGVGGQAASEPTGRSSTTAGAAATGDPATVPSTTTEASTTTTSAPRAPIVLGFAGDTSFTHGNHQRDPLGAVAGLLSRPDLMVVNLETAIADEGVGRPDDKQFVFRSPPASVDLLVEAGVDAVALANNHVLDYGPEAVAQTVRELDARGVHRAGAGVDEAEAYRPAIVPVGDWTVGLVSVSRVPCDWSASGVNVRPQVAWACPPFLDQVDASVAEARAAADVVVVMAHGGVERDLCPSPAMGELVSRLADLGVDLVVNSHPHVLQGVEQVGDALVIHSTGNFAFPSARGLTANSAVFLVEVSEQGLGLQVEPVLVPGGIAVPAEGGSRQAILDQITEHSFGWVVDADGSARPDPTAVGACGPASDPQR